MITAIGRVEDLRWLPARNLLRFTRYDAAEQPGIWEMRTPDGIAAPVSRYPTCARVGGWSGDGSVFAFSARVTQRSDVWAERQGPGGANRLVRITAGPMDFEHPTPSPDGRSIVAIGTQQRGELVRFEPKKERFARYLEGINAVDLDFSRDGRWVTYVRLPDHTLWKAHADGSAAV